MANYQKKKPKGFSESLFEECFKDFPLESKVKIAEILGKIHQVCKL